MTIKKWILYFCEIGPGLPYANTVTPRSHPNGFYYNVQTYDNPKQNTILPVAANTLPVAANPVNPYALGGYPYDYKNQFALQQPYYNQGPLNANAGYNPYVVAPYYTAAASPYFTNPYAANPYAYAGYPHTPNAVPLG